MAYNIDAVELSACFNDAASSLYSYDLLTEDGAFAFGEYLNLHVEFSPASGNFSNGQKFLFNPCFFAAQQYAPSLPEKMGWLIEVVDITTSLFSVSLHLGGYPYEYLERNFKLSVSSPAHDEIHFDFEFFAAQDIFRYTQDVGIVNRNFLQTSGLGQGITELSQPNVYSQVCYLEFLLVEVDATLAPSPTPPKTDPYVRSPLNPAQKTFSRAVAGRFIDNGFLNSQAYSGTALIKNSLRNVDISAAGFTKITEISRIAYPVLSPINDANFSVSTSTGVLQNSLMLGVENEVALTIDSPEFAPDVVYLHLLRVDDTALVGAQNFEREYEVDFSEMPTVPDATPYPNFLSGSARISTPASISYSGGATTLRFSIDGAALTPLAEYRIWAALYDTAARAVSVHLTPALQANLRAIPSATMVAAISSYNNTFTGNAVLMTTLARYSPVIVIDASSYTGVSFANELKSVSFSVHYGSQIVARGGYDFQARISSTDPSVSLAVFGSNYAFSYVDRLPYNGSGSPQALTIVWGVEYEYWDITGILKPIAYTVTQYVNVRPENVSRIAAIDFLDYTDWLASIETPVLQICDDNNYVVVKVTKSGAPDANLIGLAILGTDVNSTNPPSIFESEGYNSPVNLPRLNSPVIPIIESTFGDNVAYFVVDTRYLPEGNLLNSVAAIIYDI